MRNSEKKGQGVRQKERKGKKEIPHTQSQSIPSIHSAELINSLHYLRPPKTRKDKKKTHTKTYILCQVHELQKNPERFSSPPPPPAPGRLASKLRRRNVTSTGASVTTQLCGATHTHTTTAQNPRLFLIRTMVRLPFFGS